MPNADVEEIIPAGRLLSRATSLTQRNYDEAKTTFLDGLTNAGISSGQLGEEIKKLIMPEANQLNDASEVGIDCSCTAKRISSLASNRCQLQLQACQQGSLQSTMLLILDTINYMQEDLWGGSVEHLYMLPCPCEWQGLARYACIMLMINRLSYV